MKEENDIDEKEEGEIKDDDDDNTNEDNIHSDASQDSPNPVNLTVNTKSNEEKKASQDDSDSEVIWWKAKIFTLYNKHTFKARIFWKLSFLYFFMWDNYYQ